MIWKEKTIKNILSIGERFLVSPFHFLSFSFYFVFRMYVHNVHGIPFQDLIRPLCISVVAGCALYVLFWLWLRKRHTAALMASTCIVAFFTYDVFLRLIQVSKLLKQPLSAIGIWVAIVVMLLRWLGKKTSKTPDPNMPAALNLMAIILLLFPTVNLLIYIGARSTPFASQTDHALSTNPSQARPDIYYIILDAYPRADVLAEKHQYDNNPFLQSLEELGFYVAECSQSNYAQTASSLASSLNMDYIQTMSPTFSPDNVELLGLFKLLEDNDLRKTFSNFGYQTITFSSGFLWAEWRDADVFISPPNGPVTEFETVILFSTPLQILDQTGSVNFDDLNAERYRARTRLVLESFDELPTIPGPKFVFIHLIVPHFPYGFGPDGNPIAPDQVNERDGYLNQIKYINSSLLPKLQTLVEESPSPPIIILQGDHGPQMMDGDAAQMKILNAYFLPDGTSQLYPSISPVNTFRVVFNKYFGAGFPLLDDISYYSDLSRRYDFTVMPNTCPH